MIYSYKVVDNSRMQYQTSISTMNPKIDHSAKYEKSVLGVPYTIYLHLGDVVLWSI
jgi:hypothetical protein